MIQYGDHVHEHENIRVRVRVRVQNPWSTQQKRSERPSLKNLDEFCFDKNQDGFISQAPHMSHIEGHRPRYMHPFCITTNTYYCKTLCE